MQVGGTSRRFGDDVDFFNGTVATSMKFGGEKRIFWSRFILETIVLPRHARDKHRESTQKKESCFCAGDSNASIGRSCSEGGTDFDKNGKRKTEKEWPFCFVFQAPFA